MLSREFNVTGANISHWRDKFLEGGRETNIYKLFHLTLSDPQYPKLLVRAEHNRLLVDGQGHLNDYISTRQLAGIQTVEVPQKKKQKSREAKLEIRFAKVTLNPSQGKKELGELSIFAVLAEEKDALPETEGLK